MMLALFFVYLAATASAGPGPPVAKDEENISLKFPNLPSESTASGNYVARPPREPETDDNQGNEAPFVPYAPTVIIPFPPKKPSKPCSTGPHKTQTSSQSQSHTSGSSFSSSSHSSSSSQSSTSSHTSSHSYTNGTKGLRCGENEYAVTCKTICPPQDCEISYTSYSCEPKPKCIPGCDCIKNHLRNKQKKCIFNENCPPPPFGGEDPSNTSPLPPKEPSESTSGTQTQSSTQSVSHSTSSSSSSSSSHSSTSSHSSSHSSSHGTCGGGPSYDCTYNKCTPTCSLVEPPNCPPDTNPCNCPPGTLISKEGGECVPREDCPKYSSCKGDRNATYTDCLIGCPSTCAKPNAEFCDAQCGKLECACNFGYLLSEINGKCIKPEDCPGGKVCKKNEQFYPCVVDCPTSYCPTSDSRAEIACDPTRPCPSRCGCEANHRWKSEKEKICILASECPRLKCTRPNEEWNPCPKRCFSDFCHRRNKEISADLCPSPYHACVPQCVCKEGYYRNQTEICVTAEECPPDN